MADRRPQRIRKQVDYVKFSSCNDEDDFENFTPPVSKKAKKEKKKNDTIKVKTRRKSSDDDFAVILVDDEEIKPAISRRKPPQRKSLDDKVYERELELALEISKLESSQSGNNTENEEYTASTEKTKDISPTKLSHADSKDEDQETKHPDGTSLHRDKTHGLQSNNSAGNGHASIDAHVADDDPACSTKRRTTSKRKYVSSEEESDESDFEEDSASDSGSDFNPDSEDSDFAAKSSKNKTKTAKPSIAKTVSKAGTVKQSAVAISTVGSTSAINPGNVPITAKSKTPVLKKVCGIEKSPLTNTVKKKPCQAPTPKNTTKSLGSSFTPVTPRSTGWIKSSVQCKSSFEPSQGSATRSPLGGVQIKSPSSGGLRLGLSRNTRVKPLHSNVKVPL